MAPPAHEIPLAGLAGAQLEAWRGEATTAGALFGAQPGPAVPPAPPRLRPVPGQRPGAGPWRAAGVPAV